MITFDFDAGRKVLFRSGYSQRQIDAINAIMNECNSQGVRLKSQVAYILATPYHEAYNWKDAGSRMTCLVELGGDTYLRSKPYYPWYGRGFAHVTHKENYQKESKRMGIDLIKSPDLLFDYKIAANSLVWCMMNGGYTTAKLTTFVNSGKTDFPNARRVINGTDKAELIAGYAMEFLKCLL